MPIPLSRNFTLDQALSIPADSVNAKFPGAQIFTEAAGEQEFTFNCGLKDPVTGLDHTVVSMTGTVDEFRLEVYPDRIETGIKVRDGTYKLLDNTYRMLFLKRKPTLTTTDERSGLPSIGGVPFEVGEFTAAQIARKICTAFSLECQWQCPNYTFSTDFSAVGRPIDILGQLVEPFQKIPAYQADIFIQGTTVFIRQRPGSFTGDVEASFSVHDARILNLVIRKKQLPTFGKVTLLGKYSPGGITGGIGNPVAYDVDETKTVDAKDASGRIISTVIRTTTFRMPLKLVIKESEKKLVRSASTNAMELVEENITNNQYEDIIFVGGQPNQPRFLEQTKSTKGYHKSDTNKRFRELKREETTHGYDENGYQALSATKNLEVNLNTGLMEAKSQTIKTLRETSNLETEQATSRFKQSSTTGGLAFDGSETQRSAGLMPGGPKPPRPIVMGSGDSTEGRAQIKLERWLSTDPAAMDVQYSNVNMTDADLARIMAQYVWLSGRWEYEIEFEGVSIPWVRKGTVIQLTDLHDDQGAHIVIPPALVEEVRLTHDESSASPRTTSSISAKAWA